MSLNLPAGVQITGPDQARLRIHPDPRRAGAGCQAAPRLRRPPPGTAAGPRRRQARIDAGEMPGLPAETKAIREGDWKIAPLPKALERRRTEITGPVEGQDDHQRLQLGR